MIVAFASPSFPPPYLPPSLTTCSANDFVVTEIDSTGQLVDLNACLHTPGLHRTELVPEISKEDDRLHSTTNPLQTETTAEAPQGGGGPHTSTSPLQTKTYQHSKLPQGGEEPQDLPDQDNGRPDQTNHPSLHELVDKSVYQQLVSMETLCNEEPPIPSDSAHTISLGGDCVRCEGVYGGGLCEV